MNLIASFSVFILAMIGCIVSGHTMVIALFVGLVAFASTGYRKGYSVHDLTKMGSDGLKDALVVVEVMFVIGFITALWRASGTISFFVYYGIKIITPNLFIIITFFLCCLLSYALGTSFGVAGTVGVIFMTLARSGGVSEIATAAAVMSGIYFGDRGSPVSSSAILVAAVTKTDILDNVKLMMKTGAAALGLCTVLYGIMSFMHPIHTVDESFMQALQSEFVISWWCIIPAVFMLVLPLFKVQVLHAMLTSIVSAILLSIFVQHMDVATLVRTMIFGYTSEGTLGYIINGGGLMSMIEVVFVVAISCTYSGIFAGTDMLGGLQDKLKPMMEYIGRFGTMVVVSFATLAMFCNQTIASMMCNDILGKPYEEAGASKSELAMDIENSVIVLSATVPWVLACSVPLNFMQVGYEIVPLSFFLYLIPICYAIQKKVANPFRTE